MVFVTLLEISSSYYTLASFPVLHHSCRRTASNDSCGGGLGNEAKYTSHMHVFVFVWEEIHLVFITFYLFVCLFVCLFVFYDL